jgi:hypothetical protein
MVQYPMKYLTSPAKSFIYCFYAKFPANSFIYRIYAFAPKVRG